MEFRNIYDPEKNEGWLLMGNPSGFEFKNPIEHYQNDLVQMFATTIRMFFQNADQKTIDKMARKKWREWKSNVDSIRIPKGLIGLLNSNSKRDQVSLLKGISISRQQLTAFIFKAWTDYKFTYSFYTSEALPSDVKESDMPPLVSVNDEKIKVIGETSLSEGKLKQVMEHRHNIFAKFLDCDNNWHCFLYTFKSLDGREKSGENHLHYISSAFGKTRDEVLAQIKSSRYNLGSLPHIRVVGE